MSHPSDTPHSSHVESRSRKALRSYIIQASTLLEIVLSGLVLIGLLLSFIPLLKWMPGLLFDGNDVEIRGFLERALDIVIGVEFIKMLAKHSPGSSLEVLLYAIARHLVVGHDSALENLLSVGAIALIIVFQPELRSALEKVGGSSFKTLKNSVAPKDKEHSKIEGISNICQAVSELSREYTGALIVIERNTPLGDIIKTGTIVNADICVSMLKNIFFNKAPLHDGAVIIRNNRIYAAGCFLPMSTNDDIIKDLGTRHRSAIGMSENSDAVVVVVSEETGTISVALNGELRRNYDYNTLKYELTTLLGGEDGKQQKSVS